MAVFTFVYGVECQVQANSQEEALAKMVALQKEEDCLCKESDCDCIYEGCIGIWEESVLQNGAKF